MSKILRLPSDASFKLYPTNTNSDYVTELMQPLDLKGEWEVALTEILYDSSNEGLQLWDKDVDQLVINIDTRLLSLLYYPDDTGQQYGVVNDEPHYQELRVHAYSHILRDYLALENLKKLQGLPPADEFFVLHKEAYENFCRVHDLDAEYYKTNPYQIKFKPQYANYPSKQVLVDEINWRVRDHPVWRGAMRTREYVWNMLKLVEGKLVLQFHTMWSADCPMIQALTAESRIVFGLNFEYMNGGLSMWTMEYIKPMTFAKNFDLMFVYCDIVEHQPVGDASAPLLRIMAKKRNKKSTYNWVQFTDVQYAKVSSNNISRIRVKITNEYGTPYSLLKQKTVLCLHFRQKPMYLR